MYSVVLAAMLTAGPTVMPGFGHGCHAGCGCGWSGGGCNWSGGYCELLRLWLVGQLLQLVRRLRRV